MTALAAMAAATTRLVMAMRALWKTAGVMAEATAAAAVAWTVASAVLAAAEAAAIMAAAAVVASVRAAAIIGAVVPTMTVALPEMHAVRDPDPDLN